MKKRILLLFLVSKVILILAAFIAHQFIPLIPMFTARSLDDVIYYQWIWGNFDGVNYLQIARHGYSYPNFAYFPFYPMVISFARDMWFMLHAVDLRRLQIGLIISNLSLLLSLFFVYKAALLDFDKKIALRTIIILLAFPTAYYYSSIYADGLFLLLATISFYAARKKAWFWAGFFGFLASLTRLVGIVLLPALLLEWYLQKRGTKNIPLIFKDPFAWLDHTIEKKKLQPLPNFSFSLTELQKFVKEGVYALFLIPLGIIAYASYLQIKYGDFLLFQKAMKEWGQSDPVFPLQVIVRYVKILATAPLTFQYFIATVELIATIAYFVLAIYVWKKIRPSYGLFMFLLLLTPTFTGTFQSMPRYILHLFPAFIGLAFITRKGMFGFWVVVVCFLLLQMLFAGLFTRGYFVA